MSRDIKNTRNRILQASLTLLEESNGKGVRMTDIAKDAGITRQALYLHFKTRAKLLIETTYYLDEVKGGDARLIPSRTAQTGIKRLEAYITAWGNYIPEIYGVASALIAMSDTDKAADSAWRARMEDMREGCEAAITALDKDKMLRADYTRSQASDILWTMLSVQNWEKFTLECGWSQQEYIQRQCALAHRIFVVE